MSGSGGSAAFTICSWNYLAYALTLRSSFLQHNTDIRFCIFIADTPRPEIETALGDIEIFVVNEKIAPPYKGMSLIYSIMEFNTAIKPFCIDYMFDILGVDNIIYLDPDIFITASLRHLVDLLGSGYEVLLTPHITAPLDDGFRPNDLDFLRCGVYNLGFIALTNSVSVRTFVAWWRRWLTEDCIVALEDGLFVDQKFCDMIPAFISNTCVLHDLGYNLAYWNLSQRELTVRKDGQLSVRDDVVKFVHFSGVNKDRPSEFSKHQNRFSRDTIGLLRPIFDAYVTHLRTNDRLVIQGTSGHTHSVALSETKYGFDDVIDGVPSTYLIKSCVRRHRKEIARFRPFDRYFFIEPSDLIPTTGGYPIGRLLAEVYFARSDLRDNFDCQTTKGRLLLLQWATDHFSLEYNIPVDWAIDPSTLSSDLIEDSPETETPRQAYDVEIPHPASLARASWPSLFRRRTSVNATSSAIGTAAVSAEPNEATMTLRRGLAVYGFLRTESGVGQSARSLADAFKTTGLPCSAHALLPAQAENKVPYPCAPSLATDLDTALLVINADNICSLEAWMDPAHIAHCKKIGFFVWELPVFPAIWSAAIDRLDEVWVPSEFVANSLRSATAKPVHIVPYPVPKVPSVDSLYAKKQFDLPIDRLVYLVTFDFNSFPERKNAYGAVRAFIDAFPKETEATPLLIVKYHGSHNRGDYLARIHAVARGRSDVIFVDKIYTAAQMRKLQAAADVYISLHRSEGFGLNLAECMNAGKLVIGTAFSGNVDFMTPRNSLLIDYVMRPIKEGEYIAWHGQWWADPNHDEAVEAMRLAERSGGLRESLGAAAGASIEEAYSLETIGRRMGSLMPSASALAEGSAPIQ